MPDPADELVEAIRGYIDPALDELHRRIDGIPAPRDGRDGRDGVKGESGKNGNDGKDGVDGLGIDDLVESYEDDGRVFVRQYFRGGEVVKEFRHTTCSPIYRGVYRPEVTYLRGDQVTFGGSQWHCNEATADKPGEGSPAWTLSVKRGRDGRSVAK